MIKRISALFLCVVMIINNVSYAKEVVTEVNENVLTTMTLDEAVNYSLKHNPNVVDINRMVDTQEELYFDAKNTYMVWQNKLRTGGYAFETPTEYLDCFGYSLEVAKLNYNSFLATKGTAEKSIEYGIKQIAYSIKDLEDSISLLEKTIKKQENDVLILEVKNNLNMVTVLDVEAARVTLNTTKLQLESLKSTLDSLKVNLKNLMGFDITKELEIKLPESEFKILTLEDINKTIEESLETNGTAIKAMLEYKQKELNYILATKTHLFIRDEKIEAKKLYSDAKARLNNSLNYIKENLLSLYNKVKSNEESTIIAKQEYEQLEIKYNQMKVMHELGMVSNHDFSSYEIALINAKNTYETKLHENILLNERWNIAITIGDIVQEEQK